MFQKLSDLLPKIIKLAQVSGPIAKDLAEFSRNMRATYEARVKEVGFQAQLEDSRDTKDASNIEDSLNNPGAVPTP